jgi:hypothetical protein
MFSTASVVINGFVSKYFLPTEGMNSIPWWSGLVGYSSRGVLVKDTRDDDLDNVPFRWIRAPEAEVVRVRRMRALTALVLVAVSLGAGVLTELLSTSHPVPQAAIAPGQALGNALTRRPPTIAAASTMALPTARALEVKATGSYVSSVSASSGSSAVVLLNSGTTQRSRQQGDQPATVARISNGQRLSSPEPARDPATQDTRASPNSSKLGPAKDYQALRDYVLGR